MIELLSHCLTSSYIVFIPLKCTNIKIYIKVLRYILPYTIWRTRTPFRYWRWTVLSFTNSVESRDGHWQHHSPQKRPHEKMLKGKILQLGLNKIFKNIREKGTYPMAPLGENLLESSLACSFRESVRDKLEVLVLGMHFDMSIWCWYSLKSSLKMNI